MKKKILLIILIVFIFIPRKVDAKVLTQSEYESYGIKRAYVVGNYLFDLSKYNPTLWDFIRAISLSTQNDEISIMEIVVTKNEDGLLERKYTSLEEGKRVYSFPKIDIKYIYRSGINPNNSNLEDKIIVS